MSETTNTRDTAGPLPYPSRDVDRSKWTSGPWDDEPDVETWTDGASGLHCAILRMPWNGQLNGYVAVPAGSSLDGCSYSDKIVPPPEFISREVNIDEDVGVIPLAEGQ